MTSISFSSSCRALTPPQLGLLISFRMKRDAVGAGLIEGQRCLRIAGPNPWSGPVGLVRKVYVDGGVGPRRECVALEIEHGLNGLFDAGRCREGISVVRDGRQERTGLTGRGGAGVCGQDGGRVTQNSPTSPARMTARMD